LQSDVPGSKRALAIMMGEEYFRAWGDLLIVEAVIPPGNEPCFAKLLDLTMLVAPGGRERTAEEYVDLLKNGGFRLARIVPTSTTDSVIEGVPE
jgi:O-methyltransferase domain